MKQQSMPANDGKTFEREVAYSFQAAGFHCEMDVTEYGPQIDLIASKPDGVGGTIRFAIECKDLAKAVGSNHIKKMKDRYDLFVEIGLNGYYLVGRNGFTPAARRYADNYGFFKLIDFRTMTDPKRRLLNSFPTTIRKYQSAEIFQKFVPLYCSVEKQSAFDLNVDISKRMKSWKQPQFVFLVADFGSGKTTLLERLNYYLQVENDAGRDTMVPIFLRLSNFGGMDVDNFIRSEMNTNHSVEMTTSQLASMMKENRCVLILDGFDEIKSYASREDRMAAFSKLFPIMSLASICCMSCRPAHFLGLDDLRTSILTLSDRSYSRQLVSAGSTKFGATANKEKLKSIMDDVAAELRIPPPTSLERWNFELVTLEPLSTQSVEKYLEPDADFIALKFHISLVGFVGRLFEIYDLGDLIRRPLLLTMLRAVIRAKEFAYEKLYNTVSTSEIYLIYIHKALDWDFQKHDRQLFTPEERYTICRALADIILERQSVRGELEHHISAQELEDYVLEYLSGRIQQTNVENIFTDIRTCNFLTYDSAGHLAFAHRSFLEFFAAQNIVRELTNGVEHQALHRPLSSEILYFIAGFFDLESEAYQAMLRIMGLVRSRASPPVLFQNLFGVALHYRQETESQLFDDCFVNGLLISKKSLVRCKFRNFDFNNAILGKVRFDSCELDGLKFKKTELNEITVRRSNGTIAFEECKSPYIMLEDCTQIRVTAQDSKIDELAVTRSSLVLSTGRAVVKLTMVDSDITFVDVPRPQLHRLGSGIDRDNAGVNERTQFEHLTLKQTKVGEIDGSNAGDRKHSVFIRKYARLDRCNVFGLTLPESNLDLWDFDECQGFVLITGELQNIKASGTLKFGRFRCDGTADGKAFRLWSRKGKLLFLFLASGLENRMREAISTETIQMNLRGVAIGNQTIGELEPLLDSRFAESKRN